MPQVLLSGHGDYRRIRLAESTIQTMGTQYGPLILKTYIPLICQYQTRVHTSNPTKKRKKQARAQIRGPYFESIYYTVCSVLYNSLHTISYYLLHKAQVGCPHFESMTEGFACLQLSSDVQSIRGRHQLRGSKTQERFLGVLKTRITIYIYINIYVYIYISL